MERSRTSVEFDGEIDQEGRISVPASIRDQLGNGSIQIRLSAVGVGAKLGDRGVTEEEIQKIAAAQLESRDQVVKFLLIEGALKGRKMFKQHVRRAVRRRDR